MTVNERLVAAELTAEFDRAITTADRSEAVTLLMRVDMSAEAAAATVDTLLADPARYGYAPNR